MEAVRRRSCVPMHASPHLQASLTAARPARSPRTARRAPPLQLNAGRAQTLRAQQHPPKRLQPASPSPPHRAAPAVWQAAPRCCRQATARCACACARPYLPIQLPWDRPAAAARSQSPAAHCIPPPVRRVEGTPGLCSCRTGTHPLPHPPPPPNTRCHRRHTASVQLTRPPQASRRAARAAASASSVAVCTSWPPSTLAV